MMKTFKETWECNVCDKVKNEASDGGSCPCQISIKFRDETIGDRRFKKNNICVCNEPSPPFPEWKLVELKEI